MKKRGYLQISFAWLFAIIVGAVILFLAIYASTKLISTEQTSLDAKTGKEIGILLNPLETSFESSKSTYFTMPVETKIFNKCDKFGNFGEQIIQISQKSFGKWTETNIDVSFENKYIFSDKEVEGKKFYIFTKPFDFPFKVSDLILLTSSKDIYCFTGADEDIEEEISNANQANLLLENCPKNSIKVCFDSNNCDVNVNTYLNRIEKDGKEIYFEGDALMYAGIFSDIDVYECQIQRLMKRIETLAVIYERKAQSISSTGCYSNLNLVGLISSVGNLESSEDLFSISNIAEDIKEDNEFASCKLW